MSLKGNLSSVDLANIFQMLSINQKEGTLIIFDGETRKSIYFSREGVSMLSRGAVARDTLGRILLRYDQIGEEELAWARQNQRETGRHLAAILKESGTVPEEVVDDALRIQIEEEIYNLFIWKDASFEFVDGIPEEEMDELDASGTRITFNVNSLIMEAARRMDEWEQIQSQVPSLREIFRYSGRNTELTDEIFQEPWVDKVLAGIDGRTSVEQILEATHGNRFEVCKVFALLVEQGAVEPLPAEDLRTEAETAVEEGDHRGAVRFLLRLEELDAEDPRIRFALGESYEVLEEPRNAATALHACAERALADGDRKAAFRLYSRIRALLPTDLEAAERLVGIFASRPLEFREDRAGVVDTARTLSDILLELGENDRAANVALRITEAVPQDLSLRHHLIHVYTASHMSSAAADEYQKLADYHARQKDWIQVMKLLRKVLSLDPRRQQVQQRLQHLQARSQKKRRGLRKVALVVVLLACAGGLTWIYFDYELDARNRIASEEAKAAAEIADLDRAVAGALVALEGLRQSLSDGGVEVESLVETFRKAEELRGRYRAQIEQDIEDLAALAEEYKFSSARSQAIQKQEELRLMLSKFANAVAGAREEIQRRAVEMTGEAERMLVLGQATAALEIYRDAWALALDPEPLRELHVDQIMATIEANLAEIGKRIREVRRLVDEGQAIAGREIALDLIREYYLSEVLRRVPLPVEVVTVPAGAEVFLNGRDTGVRTPGWVLWHPGEDGLLSFQLEGFSPEVTELVAADPQQLTAETERLAALTRIEVDLEKQLTWEDRVDGAVQAAPVPCGEGVLLATRKAILYRAAPKDHDLLELHQAESIGGVVSAPATDGVRAFLATLEGQLICLDVTDGRVRWTQRLPGRVQAPLVLAGEVLVVGDLSGRLSVYDAVSGDLRWRQRVGDEIRDPPVVASGRVFAVAVSGTVRSFDLVDPERGYTVRPVGLGGSAYGPALLGGRVCVASRGGKIVALDAANGAEDWNVRLPTDVHTPPVATRGVLVVSGIDGNLYAIRDGKVLATLHLSSASSNRLRAIGDEVVLATETGTLLGVRWDGESLELAWRVDLPSAEEGPARVTAPAVAVGPWIVVATEEGRIFSLGK